MSITRQGNGYNTWSKTHETNIYMRASWRRYWLSSQTTIASVTNKRSHTMPHVNFVIIEKKLPAIPTKCVQKKSRKCVLLTRHNNSCEWWCGPTKRRPPQKHEKRPLLYNIGTKVELPRMSGPVSRHDSSIFLRWFYCKELTRLAMPSQIYRNVDISFPLFHTDIHTSIWHIEWLNPTLIPNVDLRPSRLSLFQHVSG